MLTIVLASHNGAERLPKTLESFTKLKPPAGGHKFVVAENGSTDSSHDILVKFKERLPLTILSSSIPAKAAALNNTISELEGELIVFTDDDVLADNDWLVQIEQVANRHPEFDVFGGSILPEWPTPPADWISRLVPLGSTYALTREDIPEGPVHPGLVWGPNMAVRKKVFDRGHRFDERFGPQPGEHRMGDETEFTTRVAKLGHRSLFVPSARVKHVIRDHQLDPDWIIQRAYRLGRDIFWKENDPSLIMDEKTSPLNIPLLFGVPRWMYRDLFEQFFCAMRTNEKSDFDRWFKAKWEYQFRLGYLNEAFTREGRELTRHRR